MRSYACLLSNLRKSRLFTDTYSNLHPKSFVRAKSNQDSKKCLHFPLIHRHMNQETKNMFHLKIQPNLQQLQFKNRR